MSQSQDDMIDDSNTPAVAIAPSPQVIPPPSDGTNNFHSQLTKDLAGAPDPPNVTMDAHPTSSLLSPTRDGFSLARNTVVDIPKEGKRVILNFLHDHKCYELIKNSGKVIVFDIKIPINLAFFALVEHDIKSAPLWDADKGSFVGLLTATDFVNILRHYYIRGSPMTELAEHSIASWRSMPPSMSHVRYPAEMKYISPECSLYDAIQALQVHRFHRLPVLDPQQHSVLTIASHRGVLEFLVSSLREQRRLYDQSIKDLGIGTFHELITVPENMPLIRVLYVLVEKKISSVPIVNVNGAVTNIYSISDVTELAKDRSLGLLDTPIGEFLDMEGTTGSREGLHTCVADDTLHMLFEKFAAAKAHRMVCVDGFNRCIGIITVSDLLRYFIE